MLTLLAPLTGIIGSLLPSVVRIFERKIELSHEIELNKIRLEAAQKNAEFQMGIENIKADTAEAVALRSHDSNIDGGRFLNALRASIRPVITYTFFFLFVAMKVSAAYVMIQQGQSVPEMLAAVWDDETMALFSTIMAFWFGSRFFEKYRSTR